MRYTVILEQESDGGYVASVPALPGCVSQGDTRIEAHATISARLSSFMWRIVSSPETPFPPKSAKNSSKSRRRRGDETRAKLPTTTTGD